MSKGITYKKKLGRDKQAHTKKAMYTVKAYDFLFLRRTAEPFKTPPSTFWRRLTRGVSYALLC